MNATSNAEMDHVPMGHKPAVAIMLLVEIWEYLKTHSGDGLRFVIILEEAHQLIGRRAEPGVSRDAADPKGYVTEFICNLLAELRALGCGIVISDQFPSRLAPEVIKATATKLTFRQTDEDDRRCLAESMLFKNREYEGIARLQPGEAYLFTEGYYRPRKIKAPNVREEVDLGPPLDCQELLECIQGERWHQEVTERRLAAELDLLVEKMNIFDNEKNRIAGQIAALRVEHTRVLAEKNGAIRPQAFASLRSDAESLREQLVSALDRFTQGFYRTLLPSEEAVKGRVEELIELRSDCARRFKQVLEPDIQACLDILDKLITISQDTKEN
jgi:hypothetical protein